MVEDTQEVQEISIGPKTGLFKRSNSYIIAKVGGKGFDPQTLKIYNGSADLVERKDFNEKLRDIISLSRGFVVDFSRFKQKRTVIDIYGEDLERKYRFEEEKRLKISRGHDGVVLYNKKLGLIRILEPEGLTSIDRIFTGWEEKTDIDSYYDGREPPKDISSYDKDELENMDHEEWERDRAFNSGNPHAFRSVSYRNGFLYVGYGQNLVKLEVKGDSLEYIDHIDFKDENWINWIESCENNILIGRHDGEIWKVSLNLEKKSNLDLGVYIGNGGIKSAINSHFQVFGNSAGENSTLGAMTAEKHKMKQDMKEGSVREVFAGEKFFGFAKKNSVKVYNEDFNEVFSKNFNTKIRCQILGDKLWVTGDKITIFSLY